MRLRTRAGEILNELLASGGTDLSEFARRYSNCPSGRDGGALGLISRGETVPEFEKPVFEMPAHTLIHRLIETRYGFHIVKTGTVTQGYATAFDNVHSSIAAWLEQASRRRATHKSLEHLAGTTAITGKPINRSEEHTSE